MQNNSFIPLALILVIGVAFYFIYGYLTPQSVDLKSYQVMCDAYRTAEPGRFSADEIQMLINEVGYLVPAELEDIKTETERNLKQCSQELARQLRRQD